MCAPTPRKITIVARGSRFNTTCMSYASNTPLQIRFLNQDAGINHDVVILPKPWGYNTPPKAVLFGAIVKGPADITYRSNGFPAGLLFMVCYVHHDTMFGLVGVAPQVSPAIGSPSQRFRITWATPANSPANYLWDVQIERPRTTTFVAWRTDLTGFGTDFTPDSGPGIYRFRVWQHHPPTGVIGYSPASMINVH